MAGRVKSRKSLRYGALRELPLIQRGRYQGFRSVRNPTISLAVRSTHPTVLWLIQAKKLLLAAGVRRFTVAGVIRSFATDDQSQAKRSFRRGGPSLHDGHHRRHVGHFWQRVRPRRRFGGG